MDERSERIAKSFEIPMLIAARREVGS